MRNSEFLVVSSHFSLLQDLFRAICRQITHENEDMMIGFVPVDEQYDIHLYGFEWKKEGESFLWNRLCSKAVGVVLLFDWKRPESVSKMKTMADFFEQNMNLPIVAASKKSQEDEHIPFKLYRGGLSMAANARFALYDQNLPNTIKELIVGLINIALEMGVGQVPVEPERKDFLPLRVKIDVLARLLSNTSFRELMDSLANEEVVNLQKYVWEKTVEIGLRLRGKDFSRKDITSRMQSTPAYQRKQNCSERVYYCKGIQCIHSNSKCARNKILEHLIAMQDAVQDWLETKKSKVALALNPD